MVFVCVTAVSLLCHYCVTMMMCRAISLFSLLLRFACCGCPPLPLAFFCRVTVVSLLCQCDAVSVIIAISAMALLCHLSVILTLCHHRSMPFAVTETSCIIPTRRRSVPFTLGCYGPSWGQCASKYSTMMGANAAQSCHAECPVSNTVSGLCVASGWTTQFNINNVTFASGAASATQVSWFALMLLMVLMSMFLSQ
eukprot:TRINITY_DN5513_c0_g1_i2.p1 TRINITY_DN5513_c0_g1~~TRINITY_DN5513_c0_g1_i2.p1  ORF type:complete len:196 (-),score=41.42 TRINITY_DN5513_c0_g1_i2:21-608(-)